METIVSLIPDETHVTETRALLQDAGMSPDRVQIINQPETVWQQLNGRQDALTLRRDLGIGMLMGFLFFGFFGLMAAGFMCYLPLAQCTGVSFSWAIFAVALVIGLLVGGFFGAMVGLGAMDEHLYDYVEGARRGQAVVIVRARGQEIPIALNILEREHALALRHWSDE